MSQADPSLGANIVAVYPDHAAAERAVRRLHEEGFAMSDLSIIGRDFQMSEEPVGFVDPSAYAKAGAGTGAWFGGLFGLMVGAAAILVPGVGPVVVAGPLAAAVLAGLEGAIAGTALGGLAGALVGWGIPRERAITYETHIQGGKFLVMVRGLPGSVDRARGLLSHEEHEPEHVHFYEPVS